MVTTVSGMQRLLETLASAPLTEDEVQPSDVRTFVSIVTERKTAGWDPYEVWLHRIKEPREGRSFGR